MLTRRGRRPWTALLVLVLAISMLPLSPAEATGTDYLATANGGVHGGFGSCTNVQMDPAFDGNDSTANTTTTCDNGNPTETVTVTSRSYRYFHLKMSFTSMTGFTNYLVEIFVGSTCVWSTRTGTGCLVNDGGGWAGGSYDKYIDAGVGTSSTTVYMVISTVGANLSSVQLFTFSASTSSLVTPPFTDYVMNLSAHNGLFSKYFWWDWAKTFNGTWLFKRIIDGSGVTTNYSDGGNTSHTQGQTESDGLEGTTSAHTRNPLDLCGLGGCTASGWRLYVHDSDTNTDVTYDIAANADGTLIALTVKPQAGYLQACFNKTTDYCPNGGGAAGTVRFNYAWGPLGTVADIKIGPQFVGPVAPGTAPIDGTPLVSLSSQTADNTLHTTSATANTAKSSTFVLYVSNSQGSSAISATVDFATNSTGTGVNPNPDQPPLTDKTNACVQGAVLVVSGVICALQTVFDMGVDQFVTGFTTLKSQLVAKQPFAMLFGTAGNLLTQVSRAQGDVSSTSTCDGIPVQLPDPPAPTFSNPWGLPTAPPGWAGAAAPSASLAPEVSMSGGHLTLTMLRCADFEPLGGQTWYRTIRTFMDPAIYALYGYALLKRFQPKTQLGG